MIPKNTDMLDEAYVFLKEEVLSQDTSPGNEDRHYRGEIEPIDFVEDQRLDYHEACIIKYVCRWQDKGGLTDLFKAAWFLMRRITLAIKDGELDERTGTLKNKS